METVESSRNLKSLKATKRKLDPEVEIEGFNRTSKIG